MRRAACGYDYINERTGEWASSVDARRVRTFEQDIKDAAEPIVKIVERVHPREMAKRRNAFINCALILSIFAMMVFMVGRYASISSMNLENLEIESKIETLEARERTLNLEIAEAGDIYTVETRAERDLGMGFPKNSQVRYVTLAAPVANVIQ